MKRRNLKDLSKLKLTKNVIIPFPNFQQNTIISPTQMNDNFEEIEYAYNNLIDNHNGAIQNLEDALNEIIVNDGDTIVNEEGRVKNEETRKANEEERKANEIDRQTEETKRIAMYNAHMNDETKRQQAHREMVDNFNAKVSEVNTAISNIPSSEELKGDKGDKGDRGDNGVTPNISIGNVITLEPNQQASVTRRGTDANPIFDFRIPKGEKGEPGGIFSGGTSTQNLANMDLSKGTNGYNSKPIRPIISFSDDDGKIGVYTKWKPILEEKNIPLNVCVVTNMIGGNYMSWEQIKELQDVYGCEILSHTVTHTNIGGHQTNKTWIEELKQSKMTLLENGLNVRGFAYPNGGYWGTKEGLVHGTNNGHWMTGLFYDYAVITMGNINTHPIKTNMGIDRVSIGSYGATNDSLDAWKARVDECFENNSWLIFLTHVDDPAHTEEDTRNLKLLIDYIKEKQIDIVTFSEGFELFGNIIETPNCTITKQGNATLEVSGEISHATKEKPGIVQIGEGLKVSDGVISVDDVSYYSKEYIDNFLDNFESRLTNLENNQGNGGGSSSNPPIVGSVSNIKVTPSTDFQINYTAMDSDGIFMHEISFNNGVDYVEIKPISGDNNTFTYTTSIAEEGSYHCKLRVTDSLGSSTIKSFTVVVEVNKVILDKVTKQGQAEIDLENGIYTLTDSDSYDNVMFYDTLGRLTDTSKTYKLCIKTLENEIVGEPSFEFNKSWILQGMTMPKLNELEVGQVIKKEFRLSQAITPTERIGYIQYAKTNTGSKIKVQMWIE